MLSTGYQIKCPWILVHTAKQHGQAIGIWCTDLWAGFAAVCHSFNMPAVAEPKLEDEDIFFRSLKADSLTWKRVGKRNYYRVGSGEIFYLTAIKASSVVTL